MRFVIFIIACFIYSYTNSQTTAPKYGNEFLSMGVGARAIGMGLVQTSLADDATAGYWNPSGLLQINTKHELSLMHAEYFGGVAQYDFGAFATKIDSSHRIGFTFIRLGVDDIPNTLNIKDGNDFNFSKITSFSISDMAAIVSYAWQPKFSNNLAFGVNLKVINRNAGPFATGWGFGLDIGTQYRTDKVLLGLMATDVTSTFTAWSFNTEAFEKAFVETNQDIPQNSIELTLPTLRPSFGYKILKTSIVGLVIATDIDFRFDGRRNVIANLGKQISIDPKIGLEASYKKLIFLRGGLMQFQKLPDSDGKLSWAVYPTAGLGFQFSLGSTLKAVKIEYALSGIGQFQQALYAHFVSLSVGFDKIKL